MKYEVLLKKRVAYFTKLKIEAESKEEATLKALETVEKDILNWYGKEYDSLEVAQILEMGGVTLRFQYRNYNTNIADSFYEKFDLIFPKKRILGDWSVNLSDEEFQKMKLNIPDWESYCFISD